MTASVTLTVGAALDDQEVVVNEVIDELKRERRALRDRLAKIDTAIEEYERWARSEAAPVGGASPPSADVAGELARTEQTPITVFEDEVRAILAGASAPLKRTEVYEALTRAGVVVGGVNALNTVASRLSRMQGIINLKGFGYWPEDRPYEPAGHPGATTSAAGLFEPPAPGAADAPAPAPDDDERGEA